MTRAFSELTPREVLALAIDVERRNAGRFETLADLYTDYDAGVHVLFLRLRDEELAHLARLEAVWSERFGSEPPPEVTEWDVKEVVEAVDLADGEHAIFDDLKVEDALALAHRAEVAARDFYRKAAASATDPTLRALFEELAALEEGHVASVVGKGGQP